MLSSSKSRLMCTGTTRWFSRLRCSSRCATSYLQFQSHTERFAQAKRFIVSFLRLPSVAADTSVYREHLVARV